MPANLIDDGRQALAARLGIRRRRPSACSTWRTRRRPRACASSNSVPCSRPIPGDCPRADSGRAANLPGRRALARIALVDDPDGRVGHRVRLHGLCPRESRGLSCRAGRLSSKIGGPARRLRYSRGRDHPRASRPNLELRDHMTTTPSGPGRPTQVRQPRPVQPHQHLEIRDDLRRGLHQHRRCPDDR